MSTNNQLANLFSTVADVLQLLDANRFKVIAYQKAARILGEMTDDVAHLDEAQLKSVDGLGKGMVSKIQEYLDTGHIEEANDLLAQVPDGVINLLDIPNMGPKKVALLWHEAGIEDLDTLKSKLDSDELTSLKGFGKKTVEKLKKDIAFMESAGERSRLHPAMTLAESFIAHLKPLKQVKRIDYAGSLRRGKETIGDIDILVAAAPKDAAAISEAFINHELVTDVLVHGETKSSVRTTQKMQVDLRVVELKQFGACLMYFTGSKEHNVAMRERAISQKMRLNEYGLWSEDGETLQASETEEDVFSKLGLAWVAPELREDRGELKLAEADDLPKLVELKDIKAELHTHTTASDGVWSIRELAEAAAARGFHTVAITDHSKGQVQANGLNEKRLEAHIKAIQQVRDELKDTIRVLAGSEVDILKDGDMDYANDLLAELDLVVASPHAALTQDPDTATKRLLRAIDNPYVTIMGHPTGRLVGRREGLSPDMKQLFAAAKARGIAMEINANSYRLDLRDTHIRAAIAAGVKLSINTDAHGPADLDQLRYGLLTARRAGATKQDIINCYTQPQLTKWINATRS